MISCSDAVRQLWEFLDGALPEADRSRVEEHLAFCRACCGEMEFAEELQGFLESQPPGSMPPEVRNRIDSFLDRLGTTRPVTMEGDASGDS